MTADDRSPYEGRSHEELAALVEELLLAGHLIDRAGMPQAIGRFGQEAMGEIAIGEWMAASPVYTDRMQRMLGFQGNDVVTIFKGMQLDIGAPPEFMDFRYEVQDAEHGGFHLAHCGALMDVEPMGPDYVETMCHAIEDPTFDATAAATNPRAQVRPIHRPPRRPADRHPHCAWTVAIEPDAAPLPHPSGATVLGRSQAGLLALACATTSLSTDDGLVDYAGPFDAALTIDRFCSATLSQIAEEACLQGHLLSRAFMVEVAERSSLADAAAMGGAQLCGVAGLVAKRLARLLGAPADLRGVASVLAVHPMLRPHSYVGGQIDLAEQSLVVSIGPSPALDDGDGLTWPAVLIDTDDRGLTSAVQVVAPTAVVERIAAQAGAVASWRIEIGRDGAVATQYDEVTLTEFSTGAAFEFSRQTPAAGRTH